MPYNKCSNDTFTVVSNDTTIANKMIDSIHQDIKSSIGEGTASIIHTNCGNYNVVECKYPHGVIFKTYLINYGQSATRPKRIPVEFVNYRKVNQSLINRLIKVSNRSIQQVEVDTGIYKLIGYDALPGGCVLQSGISNISTSNQAAEVNNVLDNTLLTVLHEKENYRLYHTLNSLDTITVKELKENCDAVNMIANNCLVTFIEGKAILSTNALGYEYIIGLPRITTVIPESTYYKLYALLSTHIVDLE